MGIRDILRNCCSAICFRKENFFKINRGLISSLVGCLAPAFIPPIHIAALYYFWQEFSRRVDRRYCSCSCWDTVFKGTYETGIASYKHIYFNATLNTFKMWVITVFSMILFYESVRRLVFLGMQSNLRFSMLLLFMSAIFSHYYSWWVYWNYWNDDYYSQWYHQFFFTMTELVSTFIVLELADIKVPITSRKALLIVGIAVLHVVAGSLDNFIENVIQREGYKHQVLRDVGLMIPDLLHVILPLCELRRYNKETRSCSSLDLRKDLLVVISFVTCGLLICTFVI